MKYFTPDRIVDMIEGVTIYDPTIPCGNFLLAAQEILDAKADAILGNPPFAASAMRGGKV